MKKVIVSVVISSIILLVLSLVMFYISAFIFPAVTQEYLSSVFRTSGKNDWLYYAHPFVLSIALKWFWERYKDIFKGSVILRAAEVAMVYCIVAMVPVLWLTFSAIDVSLPMVLTWLLYGLIQAFVAGIIYAKLNP
jgi:predicted neutral ceramidase superfamily lipid hydrolase